MDISVVIPAFNEDESLPELSTWIAQVMAKNNFSYEVIIVDDGSTDDTWETISGIAISNPHFKGIHMQRNYGKSACLNEGFKAAQGNVVITMDADMQDSPDEIPALYSMISQQGYDLVSGWKKVRYDNALTKNLPSKLFNAVARQSSGLPLHDFNCGLKAYRSKVVKSIEVFGEMHRWIPILAKWAGFRKIGEKIVEHRARQYGRSKFGMERFINGFLDLFTLMFVGRFGKRPMHFFGLWGTMAFMVGFFIFLYLTITKYFFLHTGLTQRPLFFFAILMMIIGSQLFLAGFLGELIMRNSPERNNYLIDKTIGLP